MSRVVTSVKIAQRTGKRRYMVVIKEEKLDMSKVIEMKPGEETKFVKALESMDEKYDGIRL